MRQVDRNDLLNGWLKYHGKTVEDVKAEQPKEVLEDAQWFKLYPVTQQQHDEWEKWAKSYTKKITKVSKWFLDRYWGFTYLDVAPYVEKK